MSDEQPTKPENERADGGDVAPPQSAQPNMDEWIARYGGRARIPWTEWDRAVEEWKAGRRCNRRFRNGAATSLFGDGCGRRADRGFHQ
jgi:hypothetical protein